MQLSGGVGALRAAQLAGVDYECLRAWHRAGVLRPSLQEPSGRGTRAVYDDVDVVVIRVVRELRDGGLGLADVRALVPTLRWLLCHQEPAATSVVAGSSVELRVIHSQPQLVVLIRRDRSQLQIELDLAGLREELSGVVVRDRAAAQKVDP